MSDTVIHIEKLGKRYRYGAVSPLGDNLRADLANWIKGLFRRGRQHHPSLHEVREQHMAQSADYFWALKDFNLEIKQSEVIGIIGRNGAGKSTLLKILSRITAPTIGKISYTGRMASLLEVGTGFHRELTGRENIFLNGSILGMKRAEIAQQFDEIVAFAEVEKFIDTPVKFYSSGMYVRLAFAVAAHLEPEIMVVDEVLSVGDAAFQKKCLGKMGTVARDGRTILYVSHNMPSVRNLCQRTVWLEQGQIKEIGDTATVTEHYLKQDLGTESLRSVADCIRALPTDPAIRLKDIFIRQNGTPTCIVFNGQPIQVAIHYEVLQSTTGLRVYFDILDDDQEGLLVRSFHDEQVRTIPTVAPGHYVSVATIPADLLAPRTYALRVQAGIYNVRCCTGDGVRISLTVESTNGINAAYVGDPIRSKLQPRIPWNTMRRTKL